MKDFSLDFIDFLENNGNNYRDATTDNSDDQTQSSVTIHATVTTINRIIR